MKILSIIATALSFIACENQAQIVDLKSVSSVGIVTGDTVQIDSLQTAQKKTIDHQIVMQNLCSSAPTYVKCDSGSPKDPYNSINFKNPRHSHIIIPPGKILSFPIFFQNETNAAGQINNSNTWVGQRGGSGFKWLSVTPGGLPINGGVSPNYGDNCVKGLDSRSLPIGWTQNPNSQSNPSLLGLCFVGQTAKVIYLNLAITDVSGYYHSDARSAFTAAIPNQISNEQGAVNNVHNTLLAQYPPNGSFINSPSVGALPNTTITTIPTSTLQRVGVTPTVSVNSKSCANSPSYVVCQTNKQKNPYNSIIFDPPGYEHLEVPAGKVISWPLEFQDDTNAIGIIMQGNVFSGGDFYEVGVKWFSVTPGGVPIDGATCVQGVATRSPHLGWSQNQKASREGRKTGLEPCFIGHQARRLFLNVAFVRNEGFPDKSKYPTAREIVTKGIPGDLSAVNHHISSLFNEIYGGFRPNSANPNL